MAPALTSLGQLDRPGHVRPGADRPVQRRPDLPRPDGARRRARGPAGLRRLRPVPGADAGHAPRLGADRRPWPWSSPAAGWCWP